MIATREQSSVKALLVGLLLMTGQAVAQAQLPAQALRPGEGTPTTGAQAPIPANPPNAPVPSPPPFPPPSVQASEPKPVERPTPAGPNVPTSDVVVMMIRSTLEAFNQANLTDNYSVLHALAAPSFQKDNDIAKLRENFASFRERKIDVSPIAVLTPRLAKPAEIDGQGFLRIAGMFPSQPLQLRFNFAYQLVDSRWRIVGLAVDASPPEVQPPSATPAAATKPAVPAKIAPAAAKVRRVVHRVAAPRWPARQYYVRRRGEPPLTTNYH
jgi:hypothetical protein